jgi:hypothetical protein
MRGREKSGRAPFRKKRKKLIMEIHLMNLVSAVGALMVGGAIGAGFGMVQEAARQRNERREREGKLKSGWALMPGSGTRVAYLLVTLVAIQLLCPLLFRDEIRWWVSGGVAGGYGFMLLRELRRRLSQN